MESSAPSITRQLISKMGAALDEDENHRKIVAHAKITEEDREIVRSKLHEAAEHIRKNYDLAIPVIRSFLHEMVDVL